MLATQESTEDVQEAEGKEGRQGERGECDSGPSLLCYTCNAHVQHLAVKWFCI